MTNVRHWQDTENDDLLDDVGFSLYFTDYNMNNLLNPIE